MNIPFVDLSGQYQGIKKEIDKAIASTLKSSQFIGGEELNTFERSFSEYIGTQNCVGCANGTDALEIALQALEIGPGDEVIVPALSWISTAEAVSTRGAKLVFADIHPSQYTMDPKSLEEKVNSKTKAIIPVHLYGQCADMDAILKIAKNHKIHVIEDSAQAHGALFKTKKAGSMGTISTFSFYPGKNLGAYGDGGAICTNDDELAHKCRMIANHGQEGKHNHVISGRNSRLDNLQAAVLNVKLRYLDKWNAQRRLAAEYYDEKLKEAGIKPPQSYKTRYHIYHIYAVAVPERDEALKFLASKGINAAVHYPTALPFLPVYEAEAHWPVEYPEAYLWSSHCLSLPIFPGITKKQQDYVVAGLKEWIEKVDQ